MAVPLMSPNPAAVALVRVPWKAPPIPEEADVGAVEERSTVLRQEQFEELARLGDRVEEALRLELINGKIREKPMPDGAHGRVIAWLTQLCIQSLSGRGLWLFPDQGLHVESYRQGNARPDATLAPIDQFVEQGEWAEPEGVLMTVEVTSYDSDTHRRDRVEKPLGYAEAGIPVYLLIDREAGQVRVHSEPENGQYGRVVTVAFGKAATLPEPVGMELDTEPLKNWVL